MNTNKLAQKFCVKSLRNAEEVKVTHKGGSHGGDNGVDITIEFSNGSLMYAQCKHYDPE